MAINKLIRRLGPWNILFVLNIFSISHYIRSILHFTEFYRCETKSNGMLQWSKIEKKPVFGKLSDRSTDITFPAHIPCRISENEDDLPSSICFSGIGRLGAFSRTIYIIIRGRVKKLISQSLQKLSRNWKK